MNWGFFETKSPKEFSFHFLFLHCEKAMIQNIFYKLLSAVDRLQPFERASAHCDVPCGIYDPSTAQISALTVIRMIDLIKSAEAEGGEKDASYFHTLSRRVAEKERHAAQCKEEVRIIWGDYFKAPQIEAHPSIHEKVHAIMLLGSKARQTLDKDAALQLLEKVNEFAEIFWQTKGVKTKRAICPYEPKQEVVYPDL